MNRVVHRATFNYRSKKPSHLGLNKKRIFVEGLKWSQYQETTPAIINGEKFVIVNITQDFNQNKLEMFSYISAPVN